MRAPDISVVLAVFNAEETIEDTLRSVLVQDGPRFEIIVIDDCSTDSTPQIVDRTVANSANATVMANRSNRGLTHSLIRGCAMARGRYIARIDAGDRFLQGRLARQYALMERDPLLGLVSCGTRFASAEGVPLYTVFQEPDELARGLERCELGNVRGPSHHGSTMFRRDVYESVGGYREVFRVAQDLDRRHKFHGSATVEKPLGLFPCGRCLGFKRATRIAEYAHHTIHPSQSRKAAT